MGPVVMGLPDQCSAGSTVPAPVLHGHTRVPGQTKLEQPFYWSLVRFLLWWSKNIPRILTTVHTFRTVLS